MLMAAVAMLASCSKDLTSDLGPNLDEQQSVQTANGGIVLELSMDDFTRVTVEGDNVAKTSKLRWEVGDEVTIAYEGATYVYVATAEGRTTDFVAKDEANAFVPTDMSKPVAVFYNVKSVDAAALTATFDVAAEQTVGELTNKVPLYSYSANVVVEGGKLVAIMKPLASVVEFELKSSKSWNIDAFTLAKSALVTDTYAVASGVVVNAATGALDLANATFANEVSVKLGSAVNLSTAQNVQAVVMGVTRSVSTTSTVEGQEVTTTTLYAPLYHGKAVLKFYKNGRENARRTIWAAYTPGAEAVDETKHIYQPIADVLKEKVADGISTAEQMKAFADAVNGSTEYYPTGAEFSNEDGVVELKNSIDLSVYSNWIAIGTNNDESQITQNKFVGVFDGKGNTISGLTVNHNKDEHILVYPTADGLTVNSIQHNAGLFGVVANGGAVKNLTVSGSIVVNMAHPTNAWAYVGGVTAQVSGGTIENCVSNVNFTAGANSTGKVRLGGVVGRVYASTDDVHITDCENNGTINLSYPSGVAGQSVVGGLVGMIADGSAGRTPYVANGKNTGSVTVFNTNTHGYIGGLFGYATSSNEKMGTFSNCKNSGAVSAGTTADVLKGETYVALSIGGIIGRLNYHKLLECENTGAVSLLNTTTSVVSVSIGGAIGYNSGGASKTSYAEKCVNKGTVTVGGVNTCTNGLCVGGFVGYANYCMEHKECKNEGAVYGNAAGSNTQLFIGGYAGKLGSSKNGKDGGVWLENCENSGTVEAYASTTVSNDTWSYPGGFVGACYGGTNITASGIYGISLEKCENKGTIRLLGGGKFRAGGFAGLNNCSAFYGCKHSGVIAMERKCVLAEVVGGICGQLENQYAIIDNCVNTGTVCSFYKTARELGETTSNIYIVLGGIIGNGGGAKPVISNCVSRGKILAAHDGTLVYDDATKNWVINLETTASYRAAIAGNCNTALVVKNCKVAGAVGVVKGGDGEDRYDATILHELNNTEGDTYYWYRWLHGYNQIPKYSGMSFYAGE